MCAKYVDVQGDPAFAIYIASLNSFWNFPGGPVAKAPSSQHKGPRFSPWSVN